MKLNCIFNIESLKYLNDESCKRRWYRLDTGNCVCVCIWILNIEDITITTFS